MCPCTMDCAERAPTCHAKCAAYLAYEAKKREAYSRSRRYSGWHGTTPGCERRIRAAKRGQTEGRRHLK